MAIEIVNIPVHFPSAQLLRAKDALSFVVAACIVDEGSSAYERMTERGELNLDLTAEASDLEPFIFEVTDLSADEQQCAGLLFLGDDTEEVERFASLLSDPGSSMPFINNHIPTLLTASTSKPTETTTSATATIVVPSALEATHPHVNQLDKIARFSREGEKRLTIDALSAFIEHFRAAPPAS